MTSIWASVNAALTSLAIPMAADEYLAATGAELPDQYIVYSLVDGVGAQHADNEEKHRRYRVEIAFRSRDGLQESDINNIVSAMLAAGFTHGPDIPLPYVTSSRHYGLALDFFFA